MERFTEGVLLNGTTPGWGVRTGGKLPLMSCLAHELTFATLRGWVLLKLDPVQGPHLSGSGALRLW